MLLTQDVSKYSFADLPEERKIKVNQPTCARLSGSARLKRKTVKRLYNYSTDATARLQRLLHP
jgi:hypothetical protein